MLYFNSKNETNKLKKRINMSKEEGGSII